MKKTIIYCITQSITGGAQKVVYSLIKGNADKYNVILICAPEGELVRWVNSLNKKIKIYELPKMKRNISLIKDIKTLLNIMNIIDIEKPDIVHCHSSKAGILGRIAAYVKGVPISVFTVHGWCITGTQNKLTEFIYKLIERFAARICTKLACVSEADRNKGISWKIAPEDKFITIYNGICFNKVEPVLRKEYNIDKDAFIIGTVARLTEQKNPLLSIDVYSKLLEENEKLLFVWVGYGPLEDLCIQEVKKRGLENRFLFTGERNDIARLIGDFNVFSLLSDWEGLPIAIIEAMFAGLPIVASDVGGIRELVIDGFNGKLVDNSDREEIRKIIRGLIDDKERMNIYAANSMDIAYNKFTESQMLKSYDMIYGS